MRNKIFFIFTFLVCLITFKTSTFAEKINSFDVDIVAHKDGLMDVAETINYDFEESDRHGIYRYIPAFSRVGDLYRIIKIDNVSVERDGKKENFEESTNKEQIYFKIGDANKTITGPHVYKISYSVENAVGSNFPEHDEIYWNATGDDWTVPIENSSIEFRTNFGLDPTSLKCFVGEVGSTEADCITLENKISSNNILYPGQGLTAVATYPKGTYPPSKLSKDPPIRPIDKLWTFYWGNFWIFWAILNILLPIPLLLWNQKRKNRKKFSNPTVNFEIPKDRNGKVIRPALVGAIDKAKITKDDISATIFDLAIRKYIKLEEKEIKRDFLPDSNKQKIIKLKEKDENLNRYEEILFDHLFKDGDEVFVGDIKKDFYKAFKKMQENIFNSLIDFSYYKKNPIGHKASIYIIGIAAIVFNLNIILGIVLFYIGWKHNDRTALGDEIDYKIDGLKLFLKSMDRNYEWQAKKFYTIEQMIPYAMSLGYIDKFMEQLKIINPDYNPTWYHGYSGSFYLSYGSFFSSMNSNMTTSAPSSSSGSSGGSSGGGGGGGGGGSW